MRKYFNIKQLLDIMKMHFYVSLAATFMGFIGLSVATGDVTKYIFSGAFVFIYVLTMYSKGEEIARKDKKNYKEDSPCFLKGLLLPVGVFVIWGLLYVLYYVTWKYDIIMYNSGFVNNMLFVVWNSVYSGFLNLNGGSFDIAGILMFFLVPVIACELGYLAGYKNFDLSVKVAKLIYEKKEKEEEDIKSDES